MERVSQKGEELLLKMSAVSFKILREEVKLTQKLKLKLEVERERDLRVAIEDMTLMVYL
jgi:hypothetical protein